MNVKAILEKRGWSEFEIKRLENVFKPTQSNELPHFMGLLGFFYGFCDPSGSSLDKSKTVEDLREVLTELSGNGFFNNTSLLVSAKTPETRAMLFHIHDAFKKIDDDNFLSKERYDLEMALIRTMDEELSDKIFSKVRREFFPSIKDCGFDGDQELVSFSLDELAEDLGVEPDVLEERVLQLGGKEIMAPRKKELMH